MAYTYERLSKASLTMDVVVDATEHFKELLLLSKLGSEHTSRVLLETHSNRRMKIEKGLLCGILNLQELLDLGHLDVAVQQQC